MLAKRNQPPITRPTSPRSPLELRTLSLTGSTTCGFGGVVGLSIVAALEKCGGVGGSVAVKSIKSTVNIVKKSDHILDSYDFLSSCCSCRKSLRGRDIYMYRGEKAFCSVECRRRQIDKDECEEICKSQTSISADISSSSYSEGMLFSTSLIVA